MKFLERVYNGFMDFPFQTAAALIIFLLALPLIRKGFRERPPAPPSSPAQQPMAPEASAWFGQYVLHEAQRVEELHTKVDALAGQLKDIGEQLGSLVKLMRTRVNRRRRG